MSESMAMLARDASLQVKNLIERLKGTSLASPYRMGGECPDADAAIKSLRSAELHLMATAEKLIEEWRKQQVNEPTK